MCFECALLLATLKSEMQDHFVPFSIAQCFVWHRQYKLQRHQECCIFGLHTLHKQLFLMIPTYVEFVTFFLVDYKQYAIR